MKSETAIGEAISIGNDSWQLQNFEQLSNKASKGGQVEALKKDKRWIENHMEYISGRIDDLISTIENQS